MLRSKLSLLLLLGALCASLGATQKAPTQPDPKCLLPKEPGPCRMSLDRYYYNPQTNACELFKFGGCRGNDNRFGHIGACEADCVQSNAATKGSATPTINAKAPTGATAGATAGAAAVGKTAPDDRNKAPKAPKTQKSK